MPNHGKRHWQPSRVDRSFPSDARLAAALLTGALGLLAAGSAAAQTTVWSATLTVKTVGDTNLGCYDALPGSECSSALTDNDFSYGGTDYTVELVNNRVDGAAFSFRLSTAIPAAFRTLRAALHVDGAQLAFADAGFNYGNAHASWNPGVSWTANQQVSLSIVVPPPQSSNANLSGLTASSSASAGGTYTSLTLSPSPFSASTVSYTATVANARTHVKVTPTVADTGRATVTVQGTSVSSGSPSAAIALNQGSNTITVRVRAQNGTTKDYTVTVTREAPPATPTVRLSADPNPVPEGSPVTVTATLSSAATSSVDIPLTLTDDTAEPEDHGPLASITIAANSTSGTGTIATNQDADAEDETFTVALGVLPSSVAAGTPSSVRVRIRDDDDDDDDDGDGDGSPPPGGGGGPPPGDDDDDAPSTCTLVAPYWSGPTGGFTVRPASGRTSVSVTCGESTTEYSAENGLVTRLVRSSCPGGLRLEGAAPGGWYWQHGERNAAAAPFVCSEALGGPRAVVPGGVVADATDDATFFKHDTARLVGIVPHLAGNECSEYVSPYWQGDGGVVLRPAEGRSTAKVSVRCGGTWSTITMSPGADGVAAELVRKDYCTDDEGEPRQGRLTVTDAAPGGWYWIDGERNAAVAPLMCADLLGGPAAVDPGGVFSQTTEDGTYFSHDVERLIGVVPHVASDRDE